MRFRHPWRFGLWAILLVAPPAFAHRPYEHVSGNFQRGDGTRISIVRHRVDGIIAADPVAILFRLPDGTEVAHTPHVFDAVVWRVPSGVEVYQFQTTWLPIASRVQIFDGYVMKDITSGKRSISPLIHFASHWLGYVIAISLGIGLVGIWGALRALPKRGWRIALRWIGFAFVACAGGLYAYDILVFEPMSPLVLAACGSMLAAFYTFVRRRTRHATVS